MTEAYKKFLLICISLQALFFGFSKASEELAGPASRDQDFSSSKASADPERYNNPLSSSKASDAPVRLSYIEKSIWKYTYMRQGARHTGTGFLIGKDRLATNLHVLLDSAFLENILKEEKAVQNISLSQEGNPTVLKVKKILHISAMHDLALLQIEGKASNYLSLGENPPRLKEDLFVSGYPEEVFKRMKRAGHSFYEDDYFYSFPVNHSTLSGVSGSPVLNDQGHVVGIISEAGEHTLTAIKLDYLKSFVKGETGLNCLGFAGAGYCIQAEMENLKSRAEKGEALAQYRLAGMYYGGMGLAQDLERAFQWWKKSAEQGHALAQNKLALMYYEGEGTAQNKERAFQWLQSSAKQGHAPSRHKLALMYYEGEGTARDKELAVYWWKQAAEQGHAPAQKLLKSLHSTFACLRSFGAGSN